MSQKLALIIGSSDYEDPKLARLAAPKADVKALESVLKDPEVGGFDDVTVLIDQLQSAVQRAIGRFFAGKRRDDLVLLYFSGHGVLDDQGQLYLAMKDTEHQYLSVTAVPSSLINREMDGSASQRKVLILDCCHSGAFARGAKGAIGARVGTAAAFEGNGYGRVVLTATDVTQYAWEGDKIPGESENSLFTHYLIEGLHTGQADVNGDGQITLDELYDYVDERMSSTMPRQTPGKWSYKQQGAIILAKNPRPIVKLAALPSELQSAIESPLAAVREGAVRELDQLLRSTNASLALAAHEVLMRLKKDDSRRVADAAAEGLAAHAERQQPRAEQTATGNTMELSEVLDFLSAVDRALSGNPMTAPAAQRARALRAIANYFRNKYKTFDLTSQKYEPEKDHMRNNSVAHATAQVIARSASVDDAVREGCADLWLCLIWSIIDEEGAHGLLKYHPQRMIETLLRLNKKGRVYYLSRQMIDNGMFAELKQIAQGYNVSLQVLQSLKQQVQPIAGNYW